MSDEPSVQSLLEANARFYSVFEALDFEGMRDMWEHSARAYCVHPGWPPLVGADPVLESWQRIIGNTAAIRFNLTAVQAHVRGNLGIVTLFESVRSNVADESHSAGAASTNLFAFDRQRGEWKIFHHHASHTIMPAAGQPDVLN